MTRRLVEAGHDVDTVMRECARALPMCTARALVGAVARECEEPRGGVCHDPDEEEAKALFSGWLRAWRSAPTAPGRDYLTWLTERSAFRAGVGDQDGGRLRGKSEKLGGWGD